MLNGDNEMDKDTVGISNFKHASYLMAVGNPIVGSVRDGKRVTFLFEKTKKLETDGKELSLGNPMVPVHDLFGPQSRLKSLIFDTT